MCNSGHLRLGGDVAEGRPLARVALDDLAEDGVGLIGTSVVEVPVGHAVADGDRVEAAAGVRYRTIRAYELASGASSASACGAAAPEDPPNLLFLSGSQENEVVPEINVGGQWRGALSYAVARALEGRAASNGVVTAYGLSEFVLRYVQSLSDAGQHPSVTWPSRKEVYATTFVVILTSIFFGVYLWGIDLVLTSAMGWILRTFGGAS